MKRERKKCKPEEEIAIFKHQLVDKVPISNLRHLHNNRLRCYFVAGKKSFSKKELLPSKKKTSSQMRKEVDKIKALEEKLQRKNEVLSEFLKEHVQQKIWGKSFKQPLRPHEHWHISVTYINLNTTYYYLCSSSMGAATISFTHHQTFFPSFHQDTSSIWRMLWKPRN